MNRWMRLFKHRWMDASDSRRAVPDALAEKFLMRIEPRKLYRLLADNVPQHDELPVARLREQGAIILGKTNVPELLTSYETDNFITGRTNHPLNPDYTPGGSSGGSAAAVAAGVLPLAWASDGAGSSRLTRAGCVRFPAITTPAAWVEALR
mgnify:CR=1 FL=1